MAKRIRWSNNERVDVPDLQAATSGGDTAATPGFAEAEARRLTVETVLTKYPAVLEGFRIRVPDQGSNPGQFIVYNAFAYDRAGRILNDESEPDANKSYQLPNPNTQYFVEAEVLMVASDVDARAFWDQTYDNGTQPSGDPQQPGREFALNVSTRMTPQWQIVTPPSNVGFDIDSNPNSTRIPIATLETNGLTQITNITKSFTAQSVLAEDYAAGATSIRVHNTRIFPDTFTLDIIQLLPTPVTESIAVTANDRVNGILTLAAPTANNHFAGQRVRDSSVGAPLFIGENYQPSVVPSSNSEDARPRLFAADEQAGFVALRSPEVNAGYTDTQIATMRDEINALAASVREMRWGGFLDSDSSSIMPTRIGQYAQANSFPPNPRWFEPAGGIQGAKACTVSVGDGVLSFGDYNTNAYPSDADAIQAAINKINDAGGLGGTLYIKRTAAFYGMNAVTPATVSIPAFTKGLTIIGDGDMTELRMNIAHPFFTLAAGAVVHFENLAITRAGAGATEPAVLAGNNATVTARNFKADGIKTVGGLGANVLNVDFENCIISSTGSHSDLVALLGRVNGVAKNCTFLSLIDNAASRAISMGASSYFKTHDCRFVTTGVNPVATIEVAASAIYSATGCLFTHSGIPTGLAGVLVAAGASQVNLDKCIMAAAGIYSLLDATNVTKLMVSGCAMSYPANSSAVKFTGGSATIQDCIFTQSAAGITGKAIYFAGGDGVEIRNVSILNADYGIVTDSIADTTRNLSIRDVTIKNSLVGAGVAGIEVACGSIYNCDISGCTIDGIKAAGGAGYGIWIAPSTDGEAIVIDGNRVTNLANATNGYGIRVVGDIVGVAISNNTIGGKTAGAFQSTGQSVGISVDDNGAVAPIDVSISCNKIVNVDSSGSTYGIEVSSYNGLSIANNSIRDLGVVLATGDTSGIRMGVNVPVTASQESISISGNTIRRLFCSGAGATFSTGILILNGAGRMTVANNTISDCDNAGGGNGIVLDGLVAGPSYLRDIVINGNSIAPSDTALFSFRDCINVQNDGSASIVISNNSALGFYGSGIRAYPLAPAALKDFVISGNTIRTDIDCVAGMAIGNVVGFSITGNQILLNLAGQNQHGILLSDPSASIGNIGSNTIKVNDPAVGYYAMFIEGTVMSIVGNLFWTGDSGAINTRGIYFANLNPSCFIAANQFQTGDGGAPYSTLMSGLSNSNTQAVTNANVKIPDNQLNWSSNA